MEVMMSLIHRQAISTVTGVSSWTKSVLIVISGVAILSVLSQLKVPMEPVPVTLQTFGVFIIGLFYPKKYAISSIMGYLFAATAGLPVLAGGESCPLWMITPTAGYLISFPLAVWTISAIKNAWQPFTSFGAVVALLASQLIIFLIGYMWLGSFIGLEAAFWFGIVPFLPGAAFKIAAAICSEKAFRDVI